MPPHPESGGPDVRPKFGGGRVDLPPTSRAGTQGPSRRGSTWHADQMPRMWCRRLVLVDRGAGRGLDGDRLGRHRPGRSRWPAATADFCARQIVWGIVALLAMFAATLPSYRLLARWSYAAFLAFAGAVGGRLFVSADQRRPALDSLRTDRIAAIGVCQAGFRAGPGALSDVSPQLSRAAGSARAAGDRRRAAGVGAQRARLGNGARFFAGAVDDAVCRRGAAATLGAGDARRSGAGAGCSGRR